MNLLEQITHKNNLEVEKNNLSLGEKQKSFLETNIGQAINTGIDFGLQVVLPDFIEDDIINVKDTLITEGFSAAVDTAVENAIDLGKSFMGIFTGDFENISQIKTAIEKGGLIDTISDLLGNTIDWAKKEDLISSSMAKTIKKGKNQIMKSVENGIDNSLESQVESIEKIDNYIEKWNKYFKEQNFTNMQKQYTKIEKELENITPLQDVITKATQVENLHELIKNNGKKFNLSQEEIELAKKLG